MKPLKYFFLQYIKESFQFQLRGLKDKLPPEVSESEAFESINSQAEAYLKKVSQTSSIANSGLDQQETSPSKNTQDQKTEEQVSPNSRIADTSNSSKPIPINTSSSSRKGGKESKEQFEPGVYVTYEVDMNGNKIFRRVRFR